MTLQNSHSHTNTPPHTPQYGRERPTGAGACDCETGNQGHQYPHRHHQTSTLVIRDIGKPEDAPTYIRLRVWLKRLSRQLRFECIDIKASTTTEAK